MIVIDTSALIDHLDGQKPARDALRREAARGELLVPAIAAWELWKGAETAADEAILDRLLDGMTVEAMTAEIAALAARLHREAHAAGRERPAMDLLIAAHAMYHACPLLTADSGFEGIAGLQVIHVRR